MLITEAENLLRFRGKRLTRQRRIILETLAGLEGHFDAFELHRKAKELDPGISLATVYRTLSVLKEVGLVREVDIGAGRGVCEVVRGVEHHHLVCIRCGRIVEFNCSHCEETHRRLAERYGFEIVSAQVLLQGYCPECRKQRNP